MKAFKQCKGRIIEIRKQISNSSYQFKLIFKKYIYQILPVTCLTLAVRFSSKTFQVCLGCFASQYKRDPDI